MTMILMAPEAPPAALAVSMTNQAVDLAASLADLIEVLVEMTIHTVDLVISLQASEADNKMTHMDLEISLADLEIHRDQAITTVLGAPAADWAAAIAAAEMMISLADNKEALMISMEGLEDLEDSVDLVDLVINMVAQEAMEMITTSCGNAIYPMLFGLVLIREN